MARLQYMVMAIGIVIISLFPLPLLSQSHSHNVNGLEEKDKNHVISWHAREAVGMLTNYLTDIADKTIARNTRSYYKGLTLKLFIGEGNDYKELILNNEGQVVDTVLRKAVTMEISSLRNPKPRKKPMALFLQGLVDNRYRSVAIQTTEIHDMKVSEIRKIEDGKYECTVYFEQVFVVGGKDIQHGVINRIPRRVTCEVDVIETDEGIEVLQLLGNMTAFETRGL